MFSTTDVYLTAALAALGCHHTATRKSDKRITFLWENPEAKDLADKYYAHKLSVDAISMSSEIKAIKTIVHNIPTRDSGE